VQHDRSYRRLRRAVLTHITHHDMDPNDILSRGVKMTGVVKMNNQKLKPGRIVEYTDTHIDSRPQIGKIKFFYRITCQNGYTENDNLYFVCVRNFPGATAQTLDPGNTLYAYKNTSRKVGNTKYMHVSTLDYALKEVDHPTLSAHKLVIRVKQLF
jgi:hypothetical protein